MPYLLSSTSPKFLPRSRGKKGLRRLILMLDRIFVKVWIIIIGGYEKFWVVMKAATTSS
jgi:hypothetical protein